MLTVTTMRKLSECVETLDDVEIDTYVAVPAIPVVGEPMRLDGRSYIVNSVVSAAGEILVFLDEA